MYSIESLERRQFLSVTWTPGEHAAHASLSPESVLAAPRKHAPLKLDLRGSWIGGWTMAGGADDGLLEVDITAQTNTTATGSIGVLGSSYRGTAKLVIGTQNRFTLTYDYKHFSGTASGKLVNGKVTGIYQWTLDGQKTHGTFTLLRQRA